MRDTARSPLLPPGEPTTAYEGTLQLPSRMATMGPAAEQSQELQAFLRRRLSLIALIALCAIATLAIILTPFYLRQQTWRYLFAVWFLTGLTAAYTALLRSRRP